MARKRTRTHEVREKKDDSTVRGKAPKRRNEVVRQMLTPEGRPGRAGPHKNKGQRGQGTKGKGKGQRHPKHKGRAYQASAVRVAARYLAASKDD